MCKTCTLIGAGLFSPLHNKKVWRIEYWFMGLPRLSQRYNTESEMIDSIKKYQKFLIK